jgi:hypothetical protein
MQSTLYEIYILPYQNPYKSKVRSKTGHAGPEWEQLYSQIGVGGEQQATLSPRKRDPVPIL